MPDTLPPAAAQRPPLPLLPATFFGMVLGLGGLGTAWRTASRVWGVPVLIGEAIVLAAVALWAAWLILFLAKWMRAAGAARAEIADPALSFAVGLAPMATMLSGVLVLPYMPGLAALVFLAGLAGGLAFAVWAMGRAWRGGRVTAANTPLMYLTPVGAGFLGAMGAGAFGHADAAAMLWGAGALSWLAIEAAVLQRLMAEGMPAPLRATVGVQMAPPAVGCMTYLAFTTGPPDKVALGLLGYALLQGLILLRLVPWLRQQPFGPGAWAYTFGMAALAVSALVMVERGQAGVVGWLAPLLFVGANGLIGWIATRTLLLARAGRLFPPGP